MVRRIKRFDFLVTLGCLALLSYFAWHAMRGPRGIDYLHKLQAQQQHLAGELKLASTDRDKLEAKVKLMRPESVDPDLLEELARSELEMSRRNELIVRIRN
jgi:cell division protein FtsB